MGARNASRGGRGVLVRLGGTAAAVLAAVGLVLLPAPAGGTAHADSGSSVTTSGTKGPYDDFSGLRVTVEQTKNLRGQGVLVSWKGAAPTFNGNGTQFAGNYVQIMQCWGDSPNGPDREHCVYGGSSASGGLTQAATRQAGFAAGDPTDFYDARETQYPADGPTRGYVPFTTVNGDTARSSQELATYIAPLTTNEQPFSSTGSQGTGEAVFQLESAAESDSLGCGAVADAAEQPEPCWLVVVPRGTHDPDGAPATTARQLATSPLAASNWAQRIVFRLDFLPIGSYCPIGQAERQTMGSEMASEAMTSWQPTLCTDDKITFGYVKQSEDFTRDQIVHPAEGSAGLALIESPVEQPPGGPPVLHAPVAVSGLVIGYNAEVSGSSAQIPRIRLNARLVAKMLTQSYQCDLPGPNTQTVRGKLPKENAYDLLKDPEFQKLNPDFAADPQGCGPGLGVPQSPSDTAAQLWRWLRSDPDARSFLSGAADPWGMRINANFLALKPSSGALAEYPKPDPTTWTPIAQYPDILITAVGLNPPGQDLQDDAVRVRRANNTGTSTVDPLAVPPKAVSAAQLPGNRFMLGVTDSATAARYRLGTAELLNPAGQFVAPTADSLTKAVAAMKPGKVAGVLDADPGLTTPGAYPLTSVTYAAASTGLDAASRTDYATMIRYAAGPGQRPGIGLGLLPPGYAPLPAGLRDQALATAAQLIAGAPPTTGPDGPGTAGGSGGGPAGDLAGGPGSATAGGTSGGAPPGAGPAGTPTPAASRTAAAAAAAGGGPAAAPQARTVAAGGGTTPGLFLGAVRWVLLIVLVTGIAGSLVGPLLMRAGTLRAAGGSLFPRGSLRAPWKEIRGDR
ncbi:hypothetical protein OG552_22855 [Streptomyces sp. NBC_01476]|uniref:hypothetical protein n=1 Tax=Streptomyces sp. NBC_01476 TaxID=2903881 RepID=UPI002E34FEB0|nr:hypothetical protein [Streptomyces sp. NBC_01476]